MRIKKTTLNAGLLYGTGHEDSWEVYFENPIPHLCRHIRQADEVYGCVFSITNRKVIRALETLQNCQILVDKSNSTPIERFGALKCNRSAKSFLKYYPQAHNDGNWDDDLEPVRVVGFKKGGVDVGLMHTKFLVFLQLDHSDEKQRLRPYAVWMGSCNFSNNAGRSLEFGYLSKDPQLARQFMKHYVEVLSRSESIYNCSRNFDPQWYKISA